MSDLREAAEWYAQHGCRVIPLNADKRPAVAWKELQQLEPVETLARLGDPELLGVLTGDVFDVLDVDGAECWADLDRLGIEMPASLGRAQTRSGGWHVFLPPTGNRNSTDLLGTGRAHANIDYRGAGGFVVVPPSPGWKFIKPLDMGKSVDVAAWRVVLEAMEEHRRDGRRQPVTAPVIAAVGEGHRWVEAKLRARVDEVAHATEGRRNATLNDAALNLGHYVPKYLDRARVEDFLTTAALSAGLEPPETRATIRSGLEAGMAEPMDPPEPSVRHRTETAPCETVVHDRMVVKDDSLFGDLEAWLRRFIRTVQDSDIELLVLWIAHTYLAHETYTTPRLLIDSPMPGSGKTTCLDHIQRLAMRPVSMASISSAALLTRMLADEPRTILIDEADRALRPDKDGVQDLLAVLNSGYKRGGTRPVLVPVQGGGWKAEEMSTFAPVAMAGNGPDLPDDTRSRTIRILLMPDLDGTVEESDWELVEEAASRLQQRLAAWADVVREDIKVCRPPLPETVRNRHREKWSPLARVAAMVGKKWPGVVDALATADVEQTVMDREDGLTIERAHIALMRHLGIVWPTGHWFVQTAVLVDELARHDSRTWGPSITHPNGITAQGMGRMLAKNYKINTRRETSGDRARGYRVEDFIPVWPRLGMPVPAWTATPSHEPDDTDSLDEPDRITSTSSSRSGSSGSKETPQERTTCAVCGEPMRVVEPGQQTHPACDARQAAR